MTFGFIGAGNMAGILIERILADGACPAGDVFLFDVDEEKCAQYAARGLTVCPGAAAAVQAAQVIFLAVKPQVFPDVLPALTHASAGKCFVSIAAGISVSYIRSFLAEDAAVIRVMPNTPMLLGNGAIAMARGGAAEAPFFPAVQRIFAACGLVRVIDEDKMNEVVAVNGSSPAIFYEIIDCIADYAVQNGIDRHDAVALAAKSMEGAAQMILQSGAPIAALIEQVSSKGGTTVAALAALREKGFDAVLTEGLCACRDRANALSRHF